MARAPQEFSRSVNPIQTMGADYARHTTASPPGFKMLSTPLTCESICHPSKEKSRIEQNRLFPHRLMIEMVFTGYFLGDRRNIYVF